MVVLGGGGVSYERGTPVEGLTPSSTLAWQVILVNRFHRLDLNHKPPDSGERQYKSRACNRQFDATLRAGGRAG